MGSGSEITVITYTYRIRFAVAVSLGPTDCFVRLDYNSDFKNYNKWRSGSDYISLDTNESILYAKYYFGTETQSVDSSLQKMHGADTLSYKNIAYASFRVDLGMSPAMPATAFTVCRYYSPLSGLDGKNIFDGSLGLNPAQILYDLLTNKFYGFGFDSSLIDVPSFQEAGRQLWAEGLSASTTISGGELFNVVRSILDWIDGELIYDEIAGKISLILRRSEYDYALLPEVFETDIRAQTFEFLRTSWYGTKNVIYVNFLDVARECDQNCVYAEDLANFNLTGNLRVQEFNFNIFTDTITAQKVCNFLLKRQSYPFAKVIFECFGKIGDSLTLFKPFRLYHEYYGIWGKVFRVTEKRRLSPNLWKIEAVEDSKSPDTLLSAIPDTIPYDPPYWEPTALTWNYRMFESYYRGYLFLGYSDEQSSEVNIIDKFLVTTDSDSSEITYACIGRLKSPIVTGTDANLYLEPDVHFKEDPVSFSYLLVDDEIMKASSCSVTTSEIYYQVPQSNRGLEGTSEANHSVGTRVFALECKACRFLNSLPRGTYECSIVPHYIYPRPFYWTDEKKVDTIEYQGLLKSPMQPGSVSASSNNWEDDITFTWSRNDREYPTPIPCTGLSAYPSETVAGVERDYIANWMVQLHVPGTTIYLTPSLIDPNTTSYYSTFASRQAAGISNYFTFEVCARGGSGYYDSPKSTYTIEP